MPTRKQRKRSQKERRHEYETVWVDSEGNELDEPPDDAEVTPRERRPDGKKPQQNRPQQRSSGGRATTTRTPPPMPSWRRSLRRSLILGVAIFAVLVIFGSNGGKHQYGSSAVLTLIYTAIFIPFTYWFDRFLYRRWEKGQPAKKR